MTSAVSTPRNVRAFIAVEVTEEARSALAALVEHLRRAQVRGLRPVDPNGIHLTLRFLGDVPESRIEPLTAEVSRVVSRHRPFTLHLSGAGAFPSGSRPRVLWVGLDGDLASLRRLYQQLGVALEELGFARERREFNAHLTIARIRDGTPPSDSLLAKEALLSADGFEHGPSILVESVALMRSILLPQGAEYHLLVLMPLGRGEV